MKKIIIITCIYICLFCVNTFSDESEIVTYFDDYISFDYNDYEDIVQTTVFEQMNVVGLMFESYNTITIMINPEKEDSDITDYYLFQAIESVEYSFDSDEAVKESVRVELSDGRVLTGIKIITGEGDYHRYYYGLSYANNNMSLSVIIMLEDRYELYDAKYKMDLFWDTLHINF